MFGFIFDVFILLNSLLHFIIDKLYLWIFVVEILTFLFIVLSFQTRVKVVSTVIMTRTNSKMTDSNTHPASSVKKKLTNAHRCKAYRAALAKDPVLFQQMKDNDKARARRNRQKPKSKEQIDHEKQLHRERQKRYV